MAETQKDIFLAGEADAWIERNLGTLQQQEPISNDPVFDAVRLVTTCAQQELPLRILEIGCGNGQRLAALSREFGAEVVGLDPSAKAVDLAQQQGVNAKVGTADTLPYPDNRFDVLIFGFCLYLCDREDLFRIAQEADRVLKPDAWLLIHDFYAEHHVSRPYHHRDGINSYKMDYRRLFDWHPAYTCFSQKVVEHGGTGFSDDPQEWVAISTLRKKMTT